MASTSMESKLHPLFKHPLIIWLWLLFCLFWQPCTPHFLSPKQDIDWDCMHHLLFISFCFIGWWKCFFTSYFYDNIVVLFLLWIFSIPPIVRRHNILQDCTHCTPITVLLPSLIIWCIQILHRINVIFSESFRLDYLLSICFHYLFYPCSYISCFYSILFAFFKLMPEFICPLG